MGGKTCPERQQRAEAPPPALRVGAARRPTASDRRWGDRLERARPHRVVRRLGSPRLPRQLLARQSAAGRGGRQLHDPRHRHAGGRRASRPARERQGRSRCSSSETPARPWLADAEPRRLVQLRPRMRASRAPTRSPTRSATPCTCSPTHLPSLGSSAASTSAAAATAPRCIPIPVTPACSTGSRTAGRT